MEALKTQLINNHSMNVNMADTAIYEYEKFLILTNICENSYPTKNIDTIWTTHILNTKHYYDYCNNNFSHTIHRNISGNENHNEKLARLKATRDKYIEYFFTDPNETIWGFKKELNMEEDKCILCYKKYDYSYQMRTSLCCDKAKICSNCFYKATNCPFCKSDKYNSVGTTVQIFIKSSKTYAIDCCVQDTVSSAKERYSHQLNCSPYSFRFRFGGKNMNDDKLLSDYNISKESTIHVIGRSRGC